MIPRRMNSAPRKVRDQSEFMLRNEVRRTEAIIKTTAKIASGIKVLLRVRWRTLLSITTGHSSVLHWVNSQPLGACRCSDIRKNGDIRKMM